MYSMMAPNFEPVLSLNSRTFFQVWERARAQTKNTRNQCEYFEISAIAELVFQIDVISW